MKSLSNIKATLAVSMLLSASLFSSNCGCPSKLVGEMLEERVSTPEFFTGGSAGVYNPGQYDGLENAPLPEKGMFVIGGSETRNGTIIENDGAVSKGALKAERANLDYNVALHDVLRDRRAAEYAIFNQYNDQRYRNNLVNEFFDVSCPKARANFVESLSEGKRKVLFDEIRQTEIDASEDSNVIEARKSIAKQSRKIYLLNAEQSLLEKAEKENSIRLNSQKKQLKQETVELLNDLQRYPDSNLVVNDPCGEKTKIKSGFRVTTFVKSKELSVDTLEAELKTAIESDRWGKREIYHTTLKMRIAEIRKTESQITEISTRQAYLANQKSKVRTELSELEKEKSCAETHMMHAVIYSATKSLDLKQLNASAIEYNDLMEQKRVPYSRDTEKSVYKHIVNGLVSYADRSDDTGKNAFLKNVRDSKELSFRHEHASARASFEAETRGTNVLEVRKARVDLIAAEVNSMEQATASVLLGREIAHLEAEIATSGKVSHCETPAPQVSTFWRFLGY